MDDLIYLPVVFLVVVLMFGFIMAPFIIIDKTSCTNYGHRVGLKTDWSFTNGCMVQVNGVWKPSKNTVEITQ